MHLYFNKCTFFGTFVIMEYKTQHIRKWLLDNKIIKVAELERISEIPEGTIKVFKRGKRDLPESHFEKVVKVLQKYGYKPLGSE